MALDADPRWRALQQGVACSCGLTHEGKFDIDIFWPEGWKHGARIEDNRAINAQRIEADFLSQDFCVVEGKYFAIRVVLGLPIRSGGPDDALNFLTWSAVSKTDFTGYANAAGRGGAPGEGRTLGHLLNDIHGYEKRAYGLRVMLEAPGDFRRPKMVLEDSDHPLVTDQRQGITLDRLFELYRAGGHEMRLGRSLN
jgi:hypothetical protein